MTEQPGIDAELDPAPRPKPPETPAEWCEWAGWEGVL